MRLQFALPDLLKLHIFTVIFAVANGVVQYKFKSSIMFGVEGKTLYIHCYAVTTGSSSPAQMPVVFWTSTSARIQDSENIKLFQKKEGLNATLIVQFSPLRLQDIKDHSVACGSSTFGGSSVSGTLHILEKVSFPKINLTSSGSTTVGSTNTFFCSASSKKSNTNDLSIKWLHYRSSPGKDSVTDLTKQATTGKDQNGTTGTITSKLPVTVNETSAGTYECEVNIWLGKAHAYPFSKNTTFAVPLQLENGVSKKQKIKVDQKKDAKMICQAVSDPPASVTWKKDGTAILASSDSRYRFSDFETTKNGVFIIKSVDYKDRAVYTCTATNIISTITMEFTLRVKDPLGALWPFIGIVIEAIVLAIIIVIYERYKTTKCTKSKSIKTKESKRSCRQDDNDINVNNGVDCINDVETRHVTINVATENQSKDVTLVSHERDDNDCIAGSCNDDEVCKRSNTTEDPGDSSIDIVKDEQNRDNITANKDNDNISLTTSL